jgi:hypothetical protein
MTMPDSGYVMANAFKNPVFFFSPHQSQTFLPCFCPPNDNPPIIFAFVSGCHFVVVRLKDPFLFPLPYARGVRGWRRFADPIAHGWADKYAHCIELGLE